MMFKPTCLMSLITCRGLLEPAAIPSMHCSSRNYPLRGGLIVILLLWETVILAVMLILGQRTVCRVASTFSEYIIYYVLS